MSWPDLGDQEHAIALTGNHMADQSLGIAVAINSLFVGLRGNNGRRGRLLRDRSRSVERMASARVANYDRRIGGGSGVRGVVAGMRWRDTGESQGGD
jgi:hypothetical protein